MLRRSVTPLRPRIDRFRGYGRLCFLQRSQTPFSIPVTEETSSLKGTRIAPNAPASSQKERVLAGADGLCMYLLDIETVQWRLAADLVLLELGALAFLICLGKLRRRRWLKESNLGSENATAQRDPKWVSREVERLCEGEDLNEPLIKHMSAEERVLFEVAIIDALNGATREGRGFLSSTLIKHGYDEQCSRRVMSPDLSDRVRATAVLNLLRPQWRDMDTEPQDAPSGEALLRVRAASRATGPLDLE